MRDRYILGLVGILAVVAITALVLNRSDSGQGADAPAGAAFSVNGTWFLVEDRAAAAELYEALSGDSASDSCALAQETMIREELIMHAAAAAGIQVSAPTADALRVTERAALGEFAAEEQAEVAATRTALGESPESAATQETDGAMKRWAFQKLREAWLVDAPDVSRASIDATIEAHKPQGYLALIEFPAATNAELNAIYGGIMSDIAEASDEADLSQRLVDRHGGDLETAVTEYSYRELSELPDYAAAVAEDSSDPGFVGEFVRPDGTGMVYYVVGNEPVDSDAMAEGIQSTADLQYLEQKEQALYDAAEVDVVVPCP